MNPEDVQNAMIYSKSPVNWLMEICLKKNIYPRFVTSDKKALQTHLPTFEVSVTVPKQDGLEEPLTAAYSGRSIREAKTRSAIAMLNLMGITKKDLWTLCSDKIKQAYANPNGTEAEAGPSSSSLERHSCAQELSGQETNVALFGFCCRVGLNQPVFEVVNCTGPPHRPEFTMSCRVDSNEGKEPFIVQEARFTSKKILKRLLATQMLEKLQLHFGKSDDSPVDMVVEAAPEKVVDVVMTWAESQPKPESMLQDKNPVNGSKPQAKDRNSVQEGEAEAMRLALEEVSKIQEYWKLGGAAIKEVQELHQAKKLLDIDDATTENLLQKIKDEQIENGFKAEYEYSVFPNDAKNGFLGYTSFTFEDQKVYGQGEKNTEAGAKSAGDRQVLQILAEMTAPPGSA